MGDMHVPSADQPKKRKKLSTRVDLTPMVDLGFLLITFFIFTAKIGEPRAMKLNLPKDTITDSTRVKENETVSIILAADNAIFTYDGKAVDEMSRVMYTAGVRELIIEKRKHMTNGEKLTILIKPMREASYKNVVDVLDEMTINQVKTYVLMEPGLVEIGKIAGLNVRS